MSFHHSFPEKSVIIGIDGGGTRTTALAARTTDREGGYEIIGKGVSKGSNFYSDTVANAAAHTIDAVEKAVPAGLAAAVVFIGNAALDDFNESPKLAEYVALLRESAVMKNSVITCRSDAFTALHALTGGKAGALLISGTGVMGMARDEKGNIYPVSGWGDRLGDEGSGYFIALEGIKAALRDFDSDRPDTPLCRALLSHYGISSPRSLIDIFYADSYDKSAAASFSKPVSDCALAGDETSRGILVRAADILFDISRTLISRSGSDIFGIYGSVLKNDPIVRERYFGRFRSEFPGITPVFPDVSAEEAAVRCCLAGTNV